MSAIATNNVTSERFDTLAPVSARLAFYSLQQQEANSSLNNVANLVHPTYLTQINHWIKWRAVYEGGEHFLEEYTKKLSSRESNPDFEKRKEVTPIPAFASGAINEIKNAIFQRMSDVSRKNGSSSYQQSIEGDAGGIDLRGSKMDWLIGDKIIPELLVMGKVGVYVDNFQLAPNESRASIESKHPYLYTYRAEDIRSWTVSTYGSKSDYISLLLRDYQYVYDPVTQLPIAEVPVFRYLWIADDDKVHVQFFNQVGNLQGEEITLDIDRIPFHVFELSSSLLKNVANHQISLLNLESSDMSFLLHGNLSFYTEQYDADANSPYIKQAQSAYNQLSQAGAFNNPNGAVVQVTDPISGITTSTTATGLEVSASDSENALLVGPTRGRKYAKGLDRPEFISPPTGPIKASIEKQQALKNDIRDLVQRQLANTRSSGASAQSKAVDQQGLEAGLAYIGLELEHGENRIAGYWAMYEATDAIASVHYPDRYYLKTPEQIQKEIDQKIQIRSEVPSKTFRSEVNKEIARLLLQTTVSEATLVTINLEIESAQFWTANAKEIVADATAGLVGIDLASQARGYPEGESDNAKTDHAERLARVQEAQTGAATKRLALTLDEKQLAANSSDPGARGLVDQSTDPEASSNEKIGKPKRGEAK